MCRAQRYPKGIVSSKIKHLHSKPSTPKRKAARFIQTSLHEWAYAQAYLTSDHRAQHLPYLASTTASKVQTTHQPPSLTENNLLNLRSSTGAQRTPRRRLKMGRVEGVH